jgi:CRP-like cAMP-binding protein
MTGIWLTADPVRAPIEPLLLDMLAPQLPSPTLRRAELDELRRGTKLAAVILEYLGLQSAGNDAKGDVRLQVVTPATPQDPWRDALLVPGGDQPIGLVLNAADTGPFVLVHEVFARFSEPQKDLVRRYAALVVRGASHHDVAAALWSRDGFLTTLGAARRQVQLLDPAILWSPDGTVRVQLGSVSQTMKDILREGHQGEQLFVLPANLFEGRTNHGDIEFIVYLNFFVRQGMRTRIAGNARQRRILHRLLTLTLFGLFDPSAPTPPLSQLRELYGVRSLETRDFLLTAHRLYAPRQDSAPDSPVLGIDQYVDYVVLEAGETVVPLGSAEARIAPAERGFDVRIVQRDGRESRKTLEVSAPPRLARTMPDEQRRAIRFATERPRFGVTALGTSHGFDPAGDLTSFVVWINGTGILVDPSPEALAYLGQAGAAGADVPYVFLTHAHADHDGGLIEKLLGGSRATVIASDPVFRIFTEKARLITGHDFEREGLVRHLAANPGRPVRIEVAGEVAELQTRWNLHPIPTNGFRITFAGRTFGYSGDTQHDPALLDELRASGRISAAQLGDLTSFFWTPDGVPTVDLLYHEAGVPPIHTDKAALASLPRAVTDRMQLVHVADVDLPADFPLAKPNQFATTTLVPATPESRERVLLATLELVPYLYDVPRETLLALLRGGEVIAHTPGALLVRKGPVAEGTAFHFQVVVDGQVSVRDGRRVIARLGKADTFGEWGISHQRGFRVADVVADRESQTIRLGEEQYRWLVGQHPVVQERISRVRALLPRLQQAQARVRWRAETSPGTRSIIEHMSANQLSSVAIFSRVRTFAQGHSVIVQGAEADGFYVLVSGHLVVRVDGQVVGELSEGDVFGELGLLGGGVRLADVTVVSADAEVLFMSARRFRTLLRTVPAFGWGIRETAASRRAVLRRRRAVSD